MACCSTFSVPSKSVTSTSWKRAADGVGDFLALRLRPVEHRHAGPPLGQRLGGGLAEPGRPADDDGLLSRDLHLAPFPKSARFVKQPSRCHFSVRLSGRRIGSLAGMASSTRHRAMAGIAAAAVALGVTQLAGRCSSARRPTARTAVGSAVIDLTPGPVKEWAITDVRHGRQARAVGAGARGDRGHRRGRRDRWETRRAADRQRGDRPRRGRRMRGGAVPRTARRSSTCADRRRHRVRGRVLRLLTSGRFADATDESAADPTSPTSPIAVGGCRW